MYKETHLDAITLLKCLGDSTRLRILLLTLEESELCVCEFVEALDFSQPKISRHLALMKTANLLNDRRQGQWIHYRINEALPQWALNIIDNAAEGYKEVLKLDKARLAKMGDRPERVIKCCNND
ncbi:ArsR family transcriptional regulator [Marinomonas sp. S3726]|nr:ArsR family transcriptional regulator [Marinomonas sp. S3726]